MFGVVTGKFTAERAEHHGQWFTNIVPIEDHALTDEARQELTDEFYRGISTHYDHILADLDIVRPTKLEEVAEAFESTRVVIVHGASGQGKTTLALRYLREHFPNHWRFQVKLIENKQHALSIAAALVGHADAIDVPIAVYADFRSGSEVVGKPHSETRTTDHRCGLDSNGRSLVLGWASSHRLASR
jgi:hypothetical protein